MNHGPAEAPAPTDLLAGRAGGHAAPPFRGGPTEMWSAIFFLDVKGKILISRNFRGDVSRAAAVK